MEFLTADEFNKIVKEGNLAFLNEVLTRVHNHAVETAMLRTPALAANLIKTSASLKTLTDNFIKDNPGFKDNMPLVQEIVQRVESENPGLTYTEVLKLSVPRINEAISKLVKI